MDLIQVFVYLKKKINNFDHSKLFELPSKARTRHNGPPLQARRGSTDIGITFSSNRVTYHWNSLSSEVASAKKLNSLKDRTDRYFVEIGVN